ncbi:hypothetical protein M422DRAFT_239270 [Sphaerobolus stellatus SS14]|nr:hypothetical protein M422DRAFT_239270 [Sphaerobolus stellatus SS14]
MTSKRVTLISPNVANGTEIESPVTSSKDTASQSTPAHSTIPQQVDLNALQLSHQQQPPNIIQGSQPQQQAYPSQGSYLNILYHVPINPVNTQTSFNPAINGPKELKMINKAIVEQDRQYAVELMEIRHVEGSHTNGNVIDDETELPLNLLVERSVAGLQLKNPLLINGVPLDVPAKSIQATVNQELRPTLHLLQVTLVTIAITTLQLSIDSKRVWLSI